MHSTPIIRALWICVLTVSLGVVAADQADFEITNPTAGRFVLRFPVYPFDALLHKRKGEVKLRCVVDERGLILDATAEGADRDFFGASVAFLEATALSIPSKAKKDADGHAIVIRGVAYDFGKCDGAHTLMSCPPKSARRIIASLRKDPSGKQFATLKSLDGPVIPVAQKEPFFPALLRGKVQQGQALIEFFIDEDGRCVLPRIVSASDDAFGYSACQAISEWRFKPPMQGGKPTVVKVRVPVNFAWKE